MELALQANVVPAHRRPGWFLHKLFIKPLLCFCNDGPAVNQQSLALTNKQTYKNVQINVLFFFLYKSYKSLLKHGIKAQGSICGRLASNSSETGGQNEK